MIRAWTRAHTLVVGAALILLTNAVALGGVFLNRSGEPDARLALSERELGFDRGGMSRRENSGMALRLHWRVESGDGEDIDYGGYYRQPAWLDEARMAELGFDTRVQTESQERRYQRGLPQPVLLVLEYDGPAWKRMLARAQKTAQAHAAAAAANPGNAEFERRAKSAADQARQERDGNSRLFVVDAGVDAAALRARYPDRARHLILAGMVRPAVRHVDGHGKRYGGFISEVAVDEINVPLAFRGELDRIRNGPSPAAIGHPPRYAVRIATGQRLEPWLEQVSPLAATLAP